MKCIKLEFKHKNFKLVALKMLSIVKILKLNYKIFFTNDVEEKSIHSRKNVRFV